MPRFGISRFLRDIVATILLYEGQPPHYFDFRKLGLRSFVIVSLSMYYKTSKSMISWKMTQTASFVTPNEHLNQLTHTLPQNALLLQMK